MITLLSIVDLKCFSFVCAYRCIDFFLVIFPVSFTLSLQMHAFVSAAHLKAERCNPSLSKMWLWQYHASFTENIMHLERTMQRKKHPNQYSSSKEDSLKVKMKGWWSQSLGSHGICRIESVTSTGANCHVQIGIELARMDGFWYTRIFAHWS